MKFSMILKRVFITVVACAAIAIPAAYLLVNAKYYTPEKIVAAKTARAEFEHNHPGCDHHKQDGVEYWDCPKCGAWMVIIKNTVSGEHGNHHCDAVARKNNLYKEKTLNRMGLDDLLCAMVEGRSTPHDFVKSYNKDGSTHWYCKKCGITVNYAGNGYTINTANIERDFLECRGKE